MAPTVIKRAKTETKISLPLVTFEAQSWEEPPNALGPASVLGRRIPFPNFLKIVAQVKVFVCGARILCQAWREVDSALFKIGGLPTKAGAFRRWRGVAAHTINLFLPPEAMRWEWGETLPIGVKAPYLPSAAYLFQERYSVTEINPCFTATRTKPAKS